ncbi:hypothetical protein [Rhizobium ruizarguesonis]|uniref:hypothetical protein n=1 Tax=Rhizobium ruizarguesonis TaxID=2081791 RepID=UPI0004806AB9|nr:hypothetical protein [Rhizobium ruizarguesonis]UFW98115.1 hypothetical protein RlegTA1_28660 [Rhizobium ruizarguesonis]
MATYLKDVDLGVAFAIERPRHDVLGCTGQKAEVPITGFGISKSTSGRLVNVLASDPLAQAQKTIEGVYIPTGTRLAFLDRSYRDTQSRTWNLVSAEDGIRAYVRGASKGQGAQYWTLSQIGQFFAICTEQIAVVQAPQTIKTRGYDTVLPDRAIVDGGSGPCPPHPRDQATRML